MLGVNWKLTAAKYSSELLQSLLQDGSGEIEIGEFCQLCATFLVEDPDMETMKRELKDAFRYRSHLGYGADGDGSGYIVIGGDNFLGNFVLHCIADDKGND